MALEICPLTIKEMNALVLRLHRHHKPVQGHRFSLGVKSNGILVGACSVGRPVARELNQYRIAEVTRLVTDGTKNACSILYAAAARTCLAMGFDSIQTYILESESGTSLKASGWSFDGVTQAKGWNCNVRKGRREDQPMCAKQRWVKKFKSYDPDMDPANY